MHTDAKDRLSREHSWTDRKGEEGAASSGKLCSQSILSRGHTVSLGTPKISEGLETRETSVADRDVRKEARLDMYRRVRPEHKEGDLF